ncbi:hypothetical protein ACQP3D_29805, partial [Escherichia coli]
PTDVTAVPLILIASEGGRAHCSKAKQHKYTSISLTVMQITAGWLSSYYRGKLHLQMHRKVSIGGVC